MAFQFPAIALMGLGTPEVVIIMAIGLAIYGIVVVVRKIL